MTYKSNLFETPKPGDKTADGGTITSTECGVTLDYTDIGEEPESQEEPAQEESKPAKEDIPGPYSPQNFCLKVSWIQAHLNAPKDKYNSFGKYSYRTAEGILKALKPLLYKAKLTLVISDDIVAIGNATYIKATARLTDGINTIENTAFAREAYDKKGMDASQMTGTSSSYARKYALNGLFAIDDAKDADTDEFHTQTM